MSDARSKFSERGKLSGLNELFLLLAEFLFASPYCFRGFLQVAHDVDHGLPAGFKTQPIPLRVL